MSYRQAKEVAHIRLELRERLLTGRLDGILGLLDRLRDIANENASADDGRTELQRECARWQARLTLLGVG